MKNRYFFIPFISLMLLCFACSSPKYTPTDFPDAQIRFGNGGGITGAVTEYVLLENGQFFKKTSTDDNYMPLPRVKKNQINQIFNNYNFLDLKSIDFNHPGNMYQFIEFKNKDSNHKITWGSNDQKPNNSVEVFYSTLKAIIK